MRNTTRCRDSVDDGAVNDRKSEHRGRAGAGQAIGAAFGVIIMTIRRITAAVRAAWRDCGLSGRIQAQGVCPVDGAEKLHELKSKQAKHGASNNCAPKEIVFCPPQIHRP